VHSPYLQYRTCPAYSSAGAGDGWYDVSVNTEENMQENELRLNLLFDYYLFYLYDATLYIDSGPAHGTAAVDSSHYFHDWADYTPQAGYRGLAHFLPSSTSRYNFRSWAVIRS